MPQYEYQGKRPRVAPDAFIAPDAVLIGDVTVGPSASVWFGCVVRGDTNRIEIGARSNIQDNSIIHTDPDAPTLIGEDVTVGHRAIVHSSVVGRNVLVGSGAVLAGHNTIGDETLIGAGALLAEHMIVPPRSVVLGVPARVVREIKPEDERWTVRAAAHYVEMAAWYRDNLRRVD